MSAATTQSKKELAQLPDVNALAILRKHELDAEIALDAIREIIGVRFGKDNPLAVPFAEEWSFYVGRVAESAMRIRRAVDLLEFPEHQNDALNAAARKVIIQDIDKLPAEQRLSIKPGNYRAWGIEIRPIARALGSAKEILGQIIDDACVKLLKSTGKFHGSNSPELRALAAAKIAAEAPDVDALTDAWIRMADEIPDEAKENLVAATQCWQPYRIMDIPRIAAYVEKHLEKPVPPMPMPSATAVQQFLERSPSP